MRQHRITPLMGWASWNAFRTNINEEKLKQQAKALVDTGLADCGYCYFNMDDGFFGGRDEQGKIAFHKDRFPNGIRAVSDYVHSLGLNAGIYAEAGDNTCGYYYDNETEAGHGVGIYNHEEEDLHQLLVENNFDFIKVDWCGALRMGLDEQTQYTKISSILHKIRQQYKKDIVYNVCRWQFPGPWVAEIADSWRTGADIAPNFTSILQQIDNITDLEKYCGPGHVNDLDMMQIGNGLNAEEEKTHFAMWCMMSTPLLIGCDLTKINPESMKILKNKNLIAVNQDKACLQAYIGKEFMEGDARTAQIWIKDLGEKNSKTKAVAFLNRSDVEKIFQFHLQDYNLQGRIVNVQNLMDLKNQDSDFSKTTLQEIKVPAHGVVVLRITATDYIKRVFPTMEDYLDQQMQSKSEEEEQKETLKPVSKEKMEALLAEGAVLIDVRTTEEYEEGHLKGAISIPYTEIHAIAPALIPDKSQKIITYCKTGKRCTQAKKSLEYLGYESVLVYTGN